MTAWLARHRSLLDLALASLGRRRARNLGLAAAFAVLVFSLASVLLLGGALRAYAARTFAGAPPLTVQRMVMGRHDLIGEDARAALAGIRGAGPVRGRLWGYLHDGFTQATFTVMVPLEGAPAPGRAVVGEGVARVRRLVPGSPLGLVSPTRRVLDLTVEAVLPAGTSLVGADLVLVDEGDFRRFFELPPGVWTDLAVAVRNPAEVPAVAAKVERALPGTRVLTARELARNLDAALSWREGFLLTPLLAAVLALGLLAWDKAAGLSAEEVREIGILKAVGWDTADVLAMKLWEGLVVALAGFLAGYLAAFLHVFWLGAPLLMPVLAGWSVLAPMGALPPQVDELQVLGLALLTLGPMAAATLVPVWSAASTDPDAGMR